MEGSSGLLARPGLPRPTRRAICARSRVAERVTVAVLVAASIAAVLAGQRSLPLFTMDDLREAEVAREILESGDWIVPHLAGRPFVEKPPGFQTLVALAFVAAGGPSAPAARLVAASFALLGLAATFLLGRRMAGPLGGAFGVVALASSGLFCRVSHAVLLDNALTAALAWAYYFGWLALEAEAPRTKRRWYAASLLSVGISFLFKGFVGPAIAAAGFLTALALARRWEELRVALRPEALAALLLPPLAWVAFFVWRAPAPLLREFFITNHLGRALHAYESHGRPFWHYAATLWIRFAPASIFLPFAARSAWKERGSRDGRGPLYLASVALGGLLLLSLSRAKDDVYLLPVYPALAAWIGVWIARRLEAPAPVWPVAAAASGLALAAAALVTFGAVVIATSSPATVGAAGTILLCAVAGVHALRRGDRVTGAAAAATLAALLAILACLPPVATWYVRARDPGPAILEATRLAGDGDLLLYRPDDRLRGGCGYFRNRTAPEVTDAAALLARLRERPGSLALMPLSLDAHPEVGAEASRLGVSVEEKHRVPGAGLCPPLVLVGIGAGPAPHP